jgi:hypothetical protein
MKEKKNNTYKETQYFQLDNTTGEHTSNYIEEKLKELEIIAEEIISFGIWRYEQNPQNKEEIFKETEERLIFRIGHGSIGPATAAAGPLLNKKMNKLYSIFKKERKP